MHCEISLIRNDIFNAHSLFPEEDLNVICEIDARRCCEKNIKNSYENILFKSEMENRLY